MKRSILFFILLFAATFSSFAQDYQEVVYLTDGSIIKGFIIEQVPNDYLKIETARGKVYTIEMYEVEKITKERAGTRTQSNRVQRTDRYENNNRYGNSRSSGNKSNYYDEYDDYDDYYAPRKNNSFGVKAGGTLANMAIDGMDNKIGFTGGIFGEFRFNNFAIQPELLFSIQGAKVSIEEDYDVDGKMNLNYLNIPVMAKFYIVEGLSLEIGPQLGILLSAKVKAESGGVEGSLDMKEFVNDIDFSLNLGASYQIPRVPVGFYTRYSLGLTNIGKDVESDDDAGKNRVFQLGAFVKF